MAGGVVCIGQEKPAKRLSLRVLGFFMGEYLNLVLVGTSGPVGVA